MTNALGPGSGMGPGDDELAGTVLAAMVFPMIDFGVRRGLDGARLLATAGLREALRADADARAPGLAMVVLWRELLAAFPDEAVPIAVVAEAERLPLGIVGPLARSAATLREAAAIAVRHGRLIDSEARTALIAGGGEAGSDGERGRGGGREGGGGGREGGGGGREGGGGGREGGGGGREGGGGEQGRGGGREGGIVIGHRPEVEALGFPFETMAAWCYRALCDLVGARVPLARVTFPHRAVRPVAPYEAFFGAPVTFAAARCGLWLRDDVLDAPMASRDDDARRYLEAHARRLMDALPREVDPFRGRLREAVAEELTSSGAELERVARRMAMSSRTLQRRLGTMGTTYQQVVEEVRHAAALRLLRERGRTILEVAFMLGYAELPSFYRAFRRWTGQTPAEWRGRREETA